MRKFYLLPMAIATLALGACSNDDVTSNDGGNSTFADGGYVALSINLPSTSSNELRAADNTNVEFNDGLATEYAVNNATLILFSGTNEASATFHSAYDLTTSMAPNNTTQITSTTEIVKKVKDPSSNQNLYALVVLNNNGLLSVNGTTAGLTVNGSTFDGTFAQFEAATAGAANGSNGVSSFNTNGFFMSNAPLSTTAGGSTQPSANTGVATLVNVTNNVYKTETEAQASPAAEIFVERAVAKVTFTSTLASDATLTGSEYTTTGSNGATVPVKVTGWGLDILSPTAYLVRHYNTAWNQYSSEYLTTADYRFIGSSAIVSNSGSGNTNFYRTYWATAPTVADVANFYNMPVASLSSLSTNFGDNYPQYCLENTTTSVANMDQNAVTRVIICAQVGNGDDIYTVNNDKSIIYTIGTLKNRVRFAILNNANVVAWINEGHTPVSTTEFDVTFSSRNAETGVISVNGFTLTDANNNTFTVTNDVLTAINNDIKTIVEYTGGKSYYAAYIKHFGDDMTPWSTSNSDVSTSTIYPAGNTTADNNFLGRYGVLRNNWYQLNVTGIRALGDATVPARPDSPVDEYDSYIGISINVLSWAKRNQSVEL